MEKPSKAFFAVIQSRVSPVGVVHQALILPERVRGDLIRFDFEPGVCEYHGWVRLEDVEIVAELGDAVQVDGKWKLAVAEAA